MSRSPLASQYRDARFKSRESSILGGPASEGCKLILPRANSSRMDVLIFDATISESPSDSVTVTQFATDVGSSISDHAYSAPTKLELSVFVTDAPVLNKGALKTTAPAVGPSMNIEELQPFPAKDRARSFYEELLTIQREFTLVSVVTGLRAYRSMIITAVKLTRNSTTGRGALRIRLSLQEIRLVEFATALVSPDAFESELAQIELALERQRQREADAEEEPSIDPDEQGIQAGRDPQSELSLRVGEPLRKAEGDLGEAFRISTTNLRNELGDIPIFNFSAPTISP